jgi:quercetin dioxygenase-like cupin family protein
MSQDTPGNETTTRGGDERETRPLAAPLSVVRVGNAADRLRGEEPYRHGDRNAVTLVKDGSLRVQLVALKAGSRLHENDPEGSLSVQVLEGRATVTVEDGSERLGEGSLAVVAAGHRWEVVAEDDSLLLLQLNWPPEPASG